MKISKRKIVFRQEDRSFMIYFISMILFSSFSSFANSCYPDFRILPQYENSKNYLSFENFGYNGIGRCRGHAIVSQKMDILAKFNPKKSPPCLGLDDETCYTVILSLIKKIMDGKIVEIDGFDSLYEFSKEPIAKQVLKNRIINIPHKYHAEESPLDVNDHPVPKINIFNDIIRRIGFKIRPYIAIKGTLRISSHALIGYKVIEFNGSKLICVRDPNVVIREAPFENCQNFLYVADDAIYYHQYGFPKDEKLFLFSIKTDDDLRTAEYIKAHLEVCSKNYSVLRLFK